MSQTIPRRPPVGTSACARAMHSAACGQQSRAARWGMPPIALPASFALVSKAFGTASKTALATFRKTKTRGNAPCRSLRVLGHTGAPRRRRGGKGLRCAAAHIWYATLRNCRPPHSLRVALLLRQALCVLAWCSCAGRQGEAGLKAAVQASRGDGGWKHSAISVAPAPGRHCFAQPSAARHKRLQRIARLGLSHSFVAERNAPCAERRMHH